MQTEQLEPRTFDAGIPTKPDVERIRLNIGVPKEGDLITYKSLESILRIPRDVCRFKTVVTAWRKELYREHEILLIAVMNKGYEVANSSTRIHYSGHQYKAGLRRVYRAGDVASKTGPDGLAEGELKLRDHLVKITATMRLAAKTAAKQLRYVNKPITG